ncbi:MAG: VOC family protein [Oscillospiraceae bacterium]|nr:VOC family protein [Oscillospiraceae bacterium]
MTRKFTFGEIVSGQVFQIGLVVPDVDVAMRFYADVMKIGPFTCNRGFRAPDGWYRGKLDMPELTITHAHTGSLFIELIQQHDDTPSVYTEFTDKHGYGLHHLGIAVAPEEFEKVMAHYYGLGFEDVFTDNLPSGARIRYIAPNSEAAIEKLRNDTGVGYFEIVEIVDLEEIFFTKMYEASLNWDGKTILRER